ncbi:MAG: PilZ domain-containing protein [bacterium]|nr:PilZ domain-containing protein [bacterium]
MIVERTYSRVASRTFQDFQVQVTAGDRYFAGELGDIAESGLCVLLPGAVRIADGEEIQGNVQSAHMPIQIQFQGRVAWTSEAVKGGRPCLLVGVAFEREIELPPAVIALGMSAA